MNIDKMVMLAEYGSIAQAEIVKSILDGAGIWAMINNEYMSAIYPTAIMPAQVIVMESDLNRAMQLLESEAPSFDDEEVEIS